MSKILVTLNYNYADEFDVDSIWITDVNEFNSLVDKLKSINTSDITDIEYYFGTNEYIIFDSIDELLDSITVQEISDKFAEEVIAKIGVTFGLIYLPDLFNFYSNEFIYGE